MTAFTERVLIVVKPALQATAESTAIVADPEGGAGTFIPGTALRTAGGPNTPAAYWTSWQMTPEQKDRLVADLGAKAGNVTIYTRSSNVPLNRNFWVFLGAQQDPVNGWTNEQVLALLGLDRYQEV